MLSEKSNNRIFKPVKTIAIDKKQFCSQHVRTQVITLNIFYVKWNLEKYELEM